jgi:hypothetical protein
MAFSGRIIDANTVFGMDSYYNFVRPHRALKFGRDVRTPAMQAGLTGRPLTFREIFCLGIVFTSICEIVVVFQNSAKALSAAQNAAALAA